jgi:hypothetical protein
MYVEPSRILENVAVDDAFFSSAGCGYEDGSTDAYRRSNRKVSKTSKTTSMAVPTG